MADTMLNDAIRASAMLCSYHTTRWSAKIDDPAAARVAAQAAGARASAYRTSKNLMDGADTHLKAVVAAQEAGRRAHMEFTLPWTIDAMSRGARMLPTMQWRSYMQAIGGAKKEYDAALITFVASYDADALTAQTNLNLVGDPARVYPPASDIASHFSVKVDFTPIPAGASFTGLPAGAKGALETAYEQRLEERMAGAVAEVFTRVRDAVGNLAERLGAPENKLNFRNAAVENVRNLAPMIEAWNLTKDERLAELAESVGKLVQGEDMASLKANAPVREMVGQEALRIIRQLDSWGV